MRKNARFLTNEGLPLPRVRNGEIKDKNWHRYGCPAGNYAAEGLYRALEWSVLTMDIEVGTSYRVEGTYGPC
jgi:hypothetical protein